MKTLSCKMSIEELKKSLTSKDEVNKKNELINSLEESLLSSKNKNLELKALLQNYRNALER